MSITATGGVSVRVLVLPHLVLCDAISRTAGRLPQRILKNRIHAYGRTSDALKSVFRQLIPLVRLDSSEKPVPTAGVARMRLRTAVWAG